MRNRHGSVPRSRLSAFLQKKVTVPRWFQAILLVVWAVIVIKSLVADIKRAVVVIAFMTLLQVVIGGIIRRQDKMRGNVPERRQAKTMRIRLHEARTLWNTPRKWTVWFMTCVIAVMALIVCLQTLRA